MHKNKLCGGYEAIALDGDMVKTNRSECVRVLMLACLGVALAGLVGCASEPMKKKDTSGLVWPSPPELPRISYVAEYHGQSDLGAKDSMKAALLGEEKGGLALKKPYGVTASDDGKLIYVTDTMLRAVVVFDIEKKEVRPLKTDAQGWMSNPLEVRLDRQGRIFVTDSERKELLVLSPEGKTLMALGKKEEIGRPTGLALDEARGRVYVADTVNHRIVVYDLEGRHLLTFGERGSEPGQLNYPVNLAVDRDGKLLVSDTGNFRVQVFDGEGTFLDAFGQLGDSYGSFSRSKGVAVDSDNNVYVIDGAFNNFQIFNRDGKLLLFVGAMGRDPGMFWLPTGIFVDRADRIYVADSINARIQVFQYIKQEGGPAVK